MRMGVFVCVSMCACYFTFDCLHEHVFIAYALFHVLFMQACLMPHIYIHNMYMHGRLKFSMHNWKSSLFCVSECVLCVCVCGCVCVCVCVCVCCFTYDCLHEHVFIAYALFHVLFMQACLMPHIYIHNMYMHGRLKFSMHNWKSSLFYVCVCVCVCVVPHMIVGENMIFSRCIVTWFILCRHVSCLNYRYTT